MKHFAILLILAMFAPLKVFAEPRCSNGTIEQLVKRFSKAYSEKKFKQFDAERSYTTPIQIIVEHSISGETEVEEIADLRSFEKWLKKRELQDGMPTQEYRQLKWCKKGLCVFDFNEGIAHNHL